VSVGLKHPGLDPGDRPTVRPPEFEGVDWGISDQRLAAHARRIRKVALRFEIAIFAAGALVLAAAAIGRLA